MRLTYCHSDSSFARVWILKMKIVSSILALVLLTGCGPTIAHLDRVVPDPPFPPFYIQSNGCTFGGWSFKPTATCSLNNSQNTPTGAGDSVRIIVSAAYAGGVSATDDANDTYKVIQTGAYPPRTGQQFYVLQAVNVPAGVQNFTVNANNQSSSTIYDEVILDYSGGTPANSTWANCYVQPGNSCLPINSGSVSVSSGALLLGIEMGIGGIQSPFTSCSTQQNQTCGNNVSTQTYMSIIYQRNSDQWCSSGCSLFVTVSSAPPGGSAYVAFPYTGQPLPNNAGWVAAIEAFQ